MGSRVSSPLIRTLRRPTESQRKSLVVAAAALMSAAVFTAGSLHTGQQHPISILYVLPIALVAIEFGLASGLVAAALAMGLFVLWEATWPGTDIDDTIALDYAVRVVAFGLLGGLVGHIADRVRRTSEEADRYFELSSDLLCIADVDGYFKRLNATSWEQTFGWTRDELLSRPFVEFVHPDDQQHVAVNVARLAASLGEPVHFEIRCRCKDGSYRVLLWKAVWIPKEQLIYAAARDVTDRKRVEAEAEAARRDAERAKEAAAERRRLVAHLMDARAEERARIARDIHDDPLQAMLAAALHLESLERRVDEPAEVEAIGLARQSVADAAERLRTLVFHVHPPELDREGLAAVLRSHLEHWVDEENMSFEIETDTRREIAPEIRTLLYRCAEETIVNARKHARAHRISVLIAERDRGFLVRVSDDGVGFKTDEMRADGRDHFGIRVLREQLELAGGSLRIRSEPGEGTSVEMWAPAP
jgi:PAS domain S-box-containing protein